MTRTFAVGGLSLTIISTLASAPSPDLARSCRDAEPKGRLYELPGTGPGNAQKEIRSHKECLAKGEALDAAGVEDRWRLGPVILLRGRSADHLAQNV